jgi:hypothetical protein
MYIYNIQNKTVYDREKKYKRINWTSRVFYFTKVPTYSINYYKHHTVPIYTVYTLYYEHPYVCTIILW